MDVLKMECCVCLTARRHAQLTTPCGHTFHEACIQALKRCPLCRAKIYPVIRSRTRQETSIELFVEKAQAYYNLGRVDLLVEVIWEYRVVLRCAGELQNAKSVVADMVNVTPRWVDVMAL